MYLKCIFAKNRRATSVQKRNLISRYEWDRHGQFLVGVRFFFFILFYFVEKHVKHFVHHHVWVSWAARGLMNTETGFYGANVSLYLRFFLSINDRLFVLSVKDRERNVLHTFRWFEINVSHFVASKWIPRFIDRLWETAASLFFLCFFFVYRATY